ncbi:MAG TPA: hypothetical protein P5234_07935 [Thermoanaerobaculaceae bacterium]|nr:hypothetical protein [Thermoanaerobaculaceae bacterium]HRS16168.1 hypothetical protein [Thermoanaerobaculaceae bacterium]
MARAKVIVGVKYSEGKRIVVCIPDGARTSIDPLQGPGTIEWEFHPSIPAEVDGANIIVLQEQPKTYPTQQPIPPELLITDLGPIHRDQSSPARVKPLYTVQNPGRRGYFFYKIRLLSKGAIWAESDPGGANDEPLEPILPWPPNYP